jgi:hypothetical protein
MSDQFHLGTSLKARAVIHNPGKEPVAFVTQNFQQPGYSAKNSSGEEVEVESTRWTTRGQAVPFRLMPGEFCEVWVPGIGVGKPNDEIEDWANVRVGSWVLAKDGDEVILQPGEIRLSGDHKFEFDLEWWQKSVRERLLREAPLPADRSERELILFRVIQDLFGTAPRTDEANAFYADTTPEALERFAERLTKREWLRTATGTIKSGTLRFKVLAADPDAATRPRIVSNEGRFNLGEELRFVVTRKLIGASVKNEADLAWYPEGKESTHTAIALPYGYGTWAAGWAPDSTTLWIAEAELLRSVDFSNPEQIKLTNYAGDDIAKAPIEEQVRQGINSAIANAKNAQPKPNSSPPAATRSP